MSRKTKIKLDDNSLCECENYFFEENNIYNCFSNDKICLTENQDYKYTNIQTKECFKTKTDCLNKNGNTEICIYNEECEFYFFNNKCFENIPPGTKLINSNSKICQCKENFEIDTSGNKCICKENYELDEKGENCVQKTQKSEIKETIEIIEIETEEKKETNLISSDLFSDIIFYLNGDNNSIIYENIISNGLGNLLKLNNTKFIQGKNNFIYEISTTEKEKNDLLNIDNSTNKVGSINKQTISIDLGEC